MKSNENRNSQPNENGNQKSQGAGSKTEAINAWWEKLPPTEREFAYELGRIVRAVREKDLTEVIEDAGKVKEDLRLLMENLAHAYKDASVGLSAAGAESWRWN